MGKSLSVARLTRWQTVLTAFLTAAAAVATLSIPFHAPWLKIAGAVLAAVGAVAAFGLAVWRAHQEAEAEVEQARLEAQAKAEQARLEAQRVLVDRSLEADHHRAPFPQSCLQSRAITRS